MALDSAILQQRIGYRFNDVSLAQRALTHRSARQEHNERLEFLGDALLGYLTAEAAWCAHPEASEGDLTIMRSALINGATLARIARELQLGELLELGAGEARSGGRDRESILACALEALLAAIYLDGGLAPCREFVERCFPAPGAGYAESGIRKDNKSRLQEFMQAAGKPLPDYQTAAVIGRGHEQDFQVCCRLPTFDIATEGSGPSRRAAEQQAAGRALALLGQPQ